MNYVNLVLKDELLLFANAYKCPLEKRRNDCALEGVSRNTQEVVEIYDAVKGLDSIDKSNLANSCKKCQKRCFNNIVL